MRKIIFIVLFVISVNSFVFSFSPPSDSDYKKEGLLFDFDINYGKTFFDNISIINIKMFTPTLYGDGNTKWSLGLSTTFSFDRNIFDIYYIICITSYPFAKYFSITFDFEAGLSSFLLLNHFSYILGFKVNFDIPVYKEHNLTIGAGIQQRNAIKIIDYLNFNDNYYGIYNSYFFEIGYRVFLK